MARKYTNRPSKQLSLDSGCTALYIRVSTEKQADEGYSLDAQRERLEAFCFGHGWNVCLDHIYVDAGVSGKSTDRAAFRAMLEAAKAGKIKRIVAMKLDRLARNVRDFLTMVDQLNEHECALVLVKESFDTSTPHGKFALTMFAAMAELEASTITERVMTGKKQKASTGGYNGARCPLGYAYTGGAFVVTDRADTVQRIFALFNIGASLNAIARELNADGTPSATGKVGSWTPYGISHILRNGFYAGLAEWDGVRGVDGSQEAIISRAEYDQAQTVLSTMKRGQRLDLAA
jgi:site-specific DNA recombinase